MKATITSVFTLAGLEGGRGCPVNKHNLNIKMASVEYVLTAEFDIDAGPTITNQYPEPMAGDKALMAELMLPDQSHARTEDWTVFFLYQEDEKSTQMEDLDSSAEQLRIRKKTLHYSLPDKHGNAKQYYVLNLVNTKFDDSVKRGAIVKSMCIITPHPFFQTFKPLLILALDDYFGCGKVECLKNLYDAINTLDLTQVPNFTLDEKRLLACSENTSLFADKFSEKEASLTEQMGYLEIKSPRGNQPTMLSPTSGGRVGRDSHFFVTNVLFKKLNIPVKVPTDQLPDSVGDFSMMKLVSLLINSQQSFVNQYHPHLTIYGPNTPAFLVLLNGLLTQKRILFVGLNASSQDVSDNILAACSLASGGILRSFTRHAFPYTDLSKVDDLLETTGYIAGVKNPTFEHHPSWWDILVDLETQQVKISKDITIPAPADINEESMNAEDTVFIDDLRRMVANHYGEVSVRARCWQYVQRFVRIACNYEEKKYGATNLWPSSSDTGYSASVMHGYTWPSEQAKNHDLQLYGAVIEGWRASRSYNFFIEDQRAFGWDKLPKIVIDYDYLLDRLRYMQLSYDESAEVFDALCSNTKDHDDIVRLLLAATSSLAIPAQTGNSTAGASNNNNMFGNNAVNSLGVGSDPMFLISLGLFHRDHPVRLMTAYLLQRIEVDSAGKQFFATLNQFGNLTYRRLLSEANKEPFVPQAGVPF